MVEILGENMKTRVHNNYHLTEEQDHAVDLSETGDSLAIEAFAGAGKTSTLSAISSALSDKDGLYLAFNKAIATDAAKVFPNNVDCRTVHSLAFRAVGYQYKHRLQRLTGYSLAKEHLKMRQGLFDFTLPQTGSLILDIIRRFCQSDDKQFTLDHGCWRLLNTIAEPVDKHAIVNELLYHARRVWDMMVDVNNDIPITHDFYLKLWGLSEPVIEKDFVLFDEAQDANPVMLDIIQQQQTQQILVGDRYQQIYSWRGSTNAMDSIETTNRCHITQSFRFGQPIADVANDILNNVLHADVYIKGFDQVNSKLDSLKKPDAILFRTNAMMIEKLMSLVSNNHKVTVSGGCNDLVSLLRGVQTLKERGKSSHHELMLFNSWYEFVEYAKTDSGSDMTSVVNIVNNGYLDDTINALEVANSYNEKNADIILTTAHKAKGREWGSVQLADDFKFPDQGRYISEESNILYVAATRAINTLDAERCEAIHHARKNPHEKYLDNPVDGEDIIFDAIIQGESL